MVTSSIAWWISLDTRRREREHDREPDSHREIAAFGCDEAAVHQLRGCTAVFLVRQRRVFPKPSDTFSSV